MQLRPDLAYCCKSLVVITHVYTDCARKHDHLKPLSLASEQREVDVTHREGSVCIILLF